MHAQSLALFAAWAVCNAQPPSPAIAAEGANPSHLTLDTVVATVEGKEVTAGEVRRMLEIAGPQFMQVYQRNPQVAIQQIYLNRYLGAEAEKLKLGDRSPLKEQLEFQRMWALATAMVNQEQNGYQVSEKDTEAYYKSHQESYRQAHVKMITVSFRAPLQAKGTSPDRVRQAAEEAFHQAHARYSEEEALQRAEEILRKVRQGADFEKLMSEYADDDLGKSGAAVIIRMSGATSEEVKSAVFALKQPGEVSEIIRSRESFCIARLVDKSTQPIDEVRSDIILALRNLHMSSWFESNMKRFAPVVKNPEFFAQPDVVMGLRPETRH
jgi:hypothetical protein